jgi:hypothetical protein
VHFIGARQAIVFASAIMEVVMRAVLLALATASLVGPAFAGQVDIATPIASPEFRTKLDTDLGAREEAYLADYAKKRIARELAKRGLSEAPGAARIEITIHDAQPNKPTFRQLGKTPGLSYADSFGVGGAELEARFTNAAGAAQTVRYKWYETDITQAAYAGPWSDAERAIRRFAVEVAKSYDASTGAGAAR